MRPRSLPALAAIAAIIACAATLPLLARADARPPDAQNVAELRVALHRLRVTGSLLYVGAHPDDDNTSVLACLARGRLVRTAYVSLTRGDGGQNILGTETGEALGVVRTQELLASRRVDGAEQFFGRALDFGFSKSPDEALAVWGHERTLADLVRVIRTFRPDVIVTRFGTDGSGGHGHHTASAILAGEAFRAAADPARFPEQLGRLSPWRARRLLWNTWAPKLDGRDPMRPKLITLDVGAFDPALGQAYSEIGGRARSLNRSQGAGTPERRGSLIEYFEPVDGEAADHDLFDGVDMTWARIPLARGLDSLLAVAERAFDAEHPSAVLPILARAHRAMAALAGDPMVTAKRRDLELVMRSCAGLWLEANAESPTVSPGDSLRVMLTAINRSDAAVSLERIDLPFAGAAFYLSAPPANVAFGPLSAAPEPKSDSTARADRVTRELAKNRPVAAVGRLVVPADHAVTQPDWLRHPPRWEEPDLPDSLIGAPEGPPAALARVALVIAGEPVTFDLPITYRWTDRVYGDRFRALEVLPAVTAQLDEIAYLFRGRAPRDVKVALKSTRGAASGAARLEVPSGWTCEPARLDFHLAPGGEQVLHFRVVPGADSGGRVIQTWIASGGGAFQLASRLQRVDYPHIPIQALLWPAEAPVVHAGVAIAGRRVGYLMGSGDAVPEAMRQMGFQVTLLSDDDVENVDLASYDCIVAGIRAYNTRPRLRALEPRLLEYVAAGGRLLVQYNTPDEALNGRLGPWPFSISRDRVTLEDAEMRVLKSAHPLLMRPNRITPRDFAGWVQERGLSYANPIDPRYETVLSSNDPGESAKDGGLIYARYGRGVFLYTGLAWFRQLPAGVPGAWRMFANLVSAAK